MKYLMAKPQLQVLWLLLSPALVLSRVLESMSPAPTPAAVPGTTGGLPRGCPSESMCGSVRIPYPFSTIQGCSLSESFMIYCNNSTNPPRPFYREYEVNSITPGTSEMNVSVPVAHICYNSSKTASRKEPRTYDFTGSPFLISPEKNEFTGIGCHTVALLGDWDGGGDDRYLSGCVTTCLGEDKAAKDGEKCTGLGCCQTPTLPGGLDKVTVGWSVGGTTASNRAWKYSSCSYGFVASKGWYRFKRRHLNGFTDDMAPNKQVPMVLDWAIPTASFKDGVCMRSNSRNKTVRDGQGYICNCSDGYHGNPYIHGGCIMVPAKAAAITATLVSILLLPLLVWLVWRVRKKQKRSGCFNKNGGEILKHMNINTYTELELKEITNNYDTPIGRGAFGKVYRGTTHENLRVAVKQRSIMEGMKRPEDNDLVNEIATQFEIRHANVVRLVGCCLETEVPMLVYEYVSNGSLYTVLHGSPPRALPLSARLDIAIGSAKALAYMHSHGGRSLVHGDVKTGNILLGDHLTPKVSDFGSSKLESITRYGSFCVTCDMSYIDPLYMKTGRFTQKSDVYSFGVVLLELITRKKAMYGNNNSSLPVEFVKSYKEDGNGRKMYDTDIMFSDGEAQSHRYVECLDQIGMLAVRCFKEDKDERPSMAEVVEELMQVKLRSCSDTSCKTS